MTYRFVLFACLQALCIQYAYSQAINRPCGCQQQQQVTVTETCVQNPPLVNLCNQPNYFAQPSCQCQPLVAQPSIITQPGCQCQQTVVAQPSIIAQPSCQCQPLVAQPSIITQPGCQCQQTVVAQPSIIAQPSCQCQPTVVAQPSVITNPCEVDYVAQYAVPATSTTIIQDDSIANNLANALQILIVSNLLSNTLPCNDYSSLGIVPALLGQPGLLGQSGLLASPALQVAQLAQPAIQLGGFGCGCGGVYSCGGGCNYIL